MSTELPDLGSPPENLDPNLRKWLVRAREHIRELRGSSGDPAGAAGSGGTGGTTIVLPGPPAPAPGPAPADPPDLTPPPTPSGVTVTAGLSAVYITTDPPLFTQGHGYARTKVYGAKYSGAGPLPTFSNASLQHEFVGEIGSFPSDLGVQWHIWVKWLTADDVESVVPFGGTNGVQVTTGKIGNADLGPLIVEAGNLATGAVTASKLAAGAVGFTAFAAGLEPVGVVGALPNPVGYTGPRAIVLTTDGKLYRLVAGAWTAAVPAADIAGTLADAQIASLAASKITGQLTNAQIASVAAAKLTGQITSTQITDGAISTPKLAAGAVTAANIAAETITAEQIAAEAITAAELAAGSVIAAKIAAGAVTATAIAAQAITAGKIAAGAVTANEIAANAITTAKIAAGAVNADQIAARAIRTDKLLVTGNGAAINDDPNTVDLSAWIGGTFSIVADTSSPTGSALSITSNGASTFSSRDIPLDASKNYNIRMKVRRVSGTATCYLLVAFFNASGALLQGSTYPLGWAGGTYHYFGLVNEVPPTSYTEYQVSFGPNESRGIPPGTAYCRVGMLANYDGAGEQRFTSIRLTEKASADLIVDGSIIAQKLAANAIAVGSAAIQNGAIVNAMIANGTIDDAKIATLAASKITAGSLNVGAFIQSSNYIAGVSGWRIDGTGPAEFAAASIRGQLTASQIDSRNLTIRDSSGNIIFDSGGARVIDGFRTTNPNPQDWSAGETFFFKSAVALGLSTPSGYGVLRTVRPYGSASDLSGGAVNQWFEGDGQVWFRRSTGTTTWSAWEAVPNGTITPANISTFIAAASIGTALIADASITNAKIGDTIQSVGYSPGVSGWLIRKSDGFAEFGAATIRGKLSAGNLVGSASNSSRGSQSLTLTAGAVQFQRYIMSSAPLLLESDPVTNLARIEGLFEGDIVLQTNVSFAGGGGTYKAVVEAVFEFQVFDGTTWGTWTNDNIVTFSNTVILTGNEPIVIPLSIGDQVVLPPATSPQVRASVSVIFAGFRQLVVNGGAIKADALASATIRGRGFLRQRPN